MGVVTVIGVGGAIVNLPFQGEAATNLAQSLANVINSEITGGTLTATSPIGGSGTAPALGAGQLGEVVITRAGSTTLTPGYKSVIDKANNENIQGVGETNQSVIASGLAMSFTSNGGSGTLVGAGYGSQANVSGSGWLVAFDNGQNTVNAISGNNTISAGNGSNLVVLGSGSNVVDVNGSDNVIMGSGSATVTVNDRSGLPSGAGAPTSSAYVTGGAGSLVFFASASNNTVVGGTGSETIYGGTGTSYYAGGSNGSNWIMGTGTLIGGGDGDTLFATGSHNVLKAGAGNETLNAAGSKGSDTIFGGTGNDSIVTGAGNSTIVAGTGSETLSAGTGTDILKIVNGAAGGHDLLLHFSGADSVSLSGYAANEATKALASATQSAGGLTVTLSDNTTITFAGVTSAQDVHLG